MATLPRLIPLVIVAIVGVVAMKAISSVEGAPAFLQQASAWAEGNKKPAKKEKPTKAAPKQSGGEVSAQGDESQAKPSDVMGAQQGSGASMSASSSSPTNALSVLGASSEAAATTSAVAPRLAPVCATSVSDLATQAGISPSELNILQSLSARRQQLDAREAQLNTQAQLVEAADAKLDARIKQLQTLKAQLEALLAETNKTSDADVARMVKVYESMKPKDAAAVLVNMSDEVRLPIAAKMKEAKLAAILGAMPSEGAKDLTEKLTLRMKRANDIQARLNQANGQAPQNANAVSPEAKNSPNAAKPSAKPAAKSGAKK